MKLALFLILFCASLQVSAVAHLEKIIGENDLVLVDENASNIPFRYRKIVDAFGHIDMGCTATHLGNGYVLTAGHCFWAPPDGVTDMPCTETKISWGLRGDKKAYLVSQCEKIIVAQRNDQQDYAIIKVSPAPIVSIAPDLNRRAIVGDTLTVFSHPMEMPLHWSKLCGYERGQHPMLPPGSIQHKCDTNPGSSGAALINAVTLKIVGIHDGGMLEFDGSGDGMNFGTFVTNPEIVQKLKELGFN